MQAEFSPSQSDSTLLVAGWANDPDGDEILDASETGIGMGLNSDGSFSLRVGAELFTSEGLSYQANNWYRLTASWSEPNEDGLRSIELRVRNLTTGADLNGGSPVVSINREVIDPATWYGLGLLVNRGLIDSIGCLLYTSPSPRDQRGSRMPSSA